MKGVDLQHPRHGRKTSYTPAEIAFDKSHGWTEITPVAKPVPVDEPPIDERADIIRRLNDAGIEFDGRLGVAKLRALLPCCLPPFS